MSDNEIIKIQQKIKELQDQNAIDFQQWKRLGKNIEKLSEKIKLSDTNLVTLMKKIKNDYESLKRIIIDENIQVQLNNKIEENKNEINKKLSIDTFIAKVDDINSQLNKKVNKTEQESEVVSRRVRGQNNPESPAGSFDFANFAHQGKETGIATTPIGGVIHHYTDGKVLQIDNVGQGNVIVTMVNANNKTRRPDKDETFFGSGYYLQLMTNNQNIGQVLSHFVIDEKANFFWNGNSRTGEKNQTTKLTTGKEYGYTPAFIFETTKKHEDMIQFKNADTVFFVIAENNTVNCAELRATNLSEGMNIKALKGDIRLQVSNGSGIRIDGNAYINKNDNRGAKEISVIDCVNSSERPSDLTGKRGCELYDVNLDKPIWVSQGETKFIEMTRLVDVPANSQSNGIKGDIATDSNYFYICYANHSWIRIAKDSSPW